jgi:hypothetical protein
LNLFSCDPFFTILSFFQYRERSCLSSAVFLVLVIVFGCFPRDNFFAAKTAIERRRSSGTPYGPCRFRFSRRSIISPSERNCNRHRDNATISKDMNQHEGEAEVFYTLSFGRTSILYDLLPWSIHYCPSQSQISRYQLSMHALMSSM